MTIRVEPGSCSHLRKGHDRGVGVRVCDVTADDQGKGTCLGIGVGGSRGLGVDGDVLSSIDDRFLANVCLGLVVTDCGELGVNTTCYRVGVSALDRRLGSPGVRSLDGNVSP